MPDLQPLVNAIASRGDIVLVALVLFALIGAALFAFTLRLLWKVVFRTLSALEGQTQASAFLKASVDANTQSANANTVAVATVAQQLAVLQKQIAMIEREINR